MAVISQTGRDRFWMWFLLALTHVITHFHRFNINVLADRLMVDFNLSAVALGNLAAAYSYTYLIMQIPGGLLIDRWGPRRAAFTIALLMGAGALVFGFAQSAAAVLVGRLLIGLGGSVVLINMIKYQAAWYREDQFATMTGLAIFVGSIGAVLATFPLAYLVGLAPWRLIFQSAGVFSVLVAAACLLWVKDRPAETGCGPAWHGAVGAAVRFSPLESVVKTLQNRPLWVAFFVNFGIFGSFVALTGAWGVTYVMQIYELTRQEAALFMLPAMLGLMLGAPVGGLMSDRLGRRKLPIVLAGFFFAANWSLLLLFSGGKPPLVILYLIAFNLGVGLAVLTLMLTYAKEMSPPALTATATAFVNTGNFAGAAVLQLLFGYILQRGWEGLSVDGVMIYPLHAFFHAFGACFLFICLSVGLTLLLKNKRPAL